MPYLIDPVQGLANVNATANSAARAVQYYCYYSIVILLQCYSLYITVMYISDLGIVYDQVYNYIQYITICIQ